MFLAPCTETQDFPGRRGHQPQRWERKPIIWPFFVKTQWRIQDFPNGGGRCFVANGGAHILFSGKKCMKLKEIGLKWGGRTSFSALL